VNRKRVEQDRWTENEEASAISEALRRIINVASGDTCMARITALQPPTWRIGARWIAHNRFCATARAALCR